MASPTSESVLLGQVPYYSQFILSPISATSLYLNDDSIIGHQQNENHGITCLATGSVLGRQIGTDFAAQRRALQRM